MLKLAPLVLSVGLLVAACKGDEPASPAGGEAMPAVATFDDRALGVWFAAPDPDFQLLTGAAAHAIHPEAVVALDNPPRCKGFVTVTPLAGRTPEEAARAIRAGLDLRDPKIVQDEELLYCGKTGWRLEAWGANAAGDQAARRVSFITAGDRLYGVFAHADGTLHTRMRRCIDALTAAFELTAAD